MTDPTPEPSRFPAITQPPWAHLSPIIAFLSLTSLEGYVPPAAYPLAYTAKLAVVIAVAWLCRSAWRDLKPLPGPLGWLVAAALGVLVIAVWVGLDGKYPTFGSLSGNRAGFDPKSISSAPGRYAFLAVRFLGLVAVVPLIEELFWRSFLVRWVIDQDFEKVPVGLVTPLGAGVSSVAFALAHPEWLPALLTGLAWAWLLKWTGSLSACVASHAIANLTLGIYVLWSGAYRFW
ncbi:CAAX prenyl protease-related protein [Isosphaeraceae bacterium EP7]